MHRYLSAISNLVSVLVIFAQTNCAVEAVIFAMIFSDFFSFFYISNSKEWEFVYLGSALDHL